MSTTPPQVLELARQGQPDAIAALMNQHLERKGITAYVAQQGNLLQVILEAAQVPPQGDLVPYVRTGISGLNLAAIHYLNVSGRQVGNADAAWTEMVQLQAEASPLPDSVIFDAGTSTSEDSLGLDADLDTLDFDLDDLNVDTGLEPDANLNFDLGEPDAPDGLSLDFDSVTDTYDATLDLGLEAASLDLGHDDLNLDLGLEDALESSTLDLGHDDLELDLGLEDALGVDLPAPTTNDFDFDLNLGTEESASIDDFDFDLGVETSSNDDLDLLLDTEGGVDSAERPDDLGFLSQESLNQDLELDLLSEEGNPPLDNSATETSFDLDLELDENGLDFDAEETDPLALDFAALSEPELFDFDMEASAPVDEMGLNLSESEQDLGLDLLGLTPEVEGEALGLNLDLDDSSELPGFDSVAFDLDDDSEPDVGEMPSLELEQDLWSSTESNVIASSSIDPSAAVPESNLDDFDWDLADDTEGSLDPLAVPETTAGDLDAIVDAFDTDNVDIGVDPIELEDIALPGADFLEYAVADGNLATEPQAEFLAAEDGIEAAIPDDEAASLTPDLAEFEFDPNLVFETEQELSNVDTDPSAKSDELFVPDLVLDSDTPEETPSSFEAEPPFLNLEEDSAFAEVWPETDPVDAYTLELESWPDHAPPGSTEAWAAEEGWDSTPLPLDLVDNEPPQPTEMGDWLDEAATSPLEAVNLGFESEAESATSPITPADTFEDAYDVDTLEVAADFGEHSKDSDLDAFDAVEWDAASNTPPPPFSVDDAEPPALAALENDDSEPAEFDNFSFKDEPTPRISDETNGFLIDDGGLDIEDVESDAADEFIHKFAPVSPEEVAQRTPSRSTTAGSRQKLILGLGLGAVALALAGLGLNAFLGRMRQPNPTTAQPPQAAPAPNNTADPANAADPFREAVNAAQTAANLAQTAKTSAEWQAVADSWAKAIDLMKQVPEGSPNHAVAQQKAVEYQPNLTYAQQNAQRVP